MEENIVYLGDGLYAEFVDAQIILRANDPYMPSDIVYIEWPDVWTALSDFVKRSLDNIAQEARHETD